MCVQLSASHVSVLMKIHVRRLVFVLNCPVSLVHAAVSNFHSHLDFNHVTTFTNIVTLLSLEEIYSKLGQCKSSYKILNSQRGGASLESQLESMINLHDTEKRPLTYKTGASDDTLEHTEIANKGSLGLNFSRWRKTRSF